MTGRMDSIGHGNSRDLGEIISQLMKADKNNNGRIEGSELGKLAKIMSNMIDKAKGRCDESCGPEDKGDKHADWGDDKKHGEWGKDCKADGDKCGKQDMKSKVEDLLDPNGDGKLGRDFKKMAGRDKKLDFGEMLEAMEKRFGDLSHHQVAQLHKVFEHMAGADGEISKGEAKHIIA